MKKNLLLTSLLVMMMPGASHAAFFDSVTISTGGSADFGTPVRIGLRGDGHQRWFESERGYLSTYYELSLNHFTDPVRPATAISFSPILIYHFKRSGKIKPFVEIGSGFSYFSRKNVGIRKSATNFQFEDRIGVGFRNGKHDWTLRYMHYSNANIKKPNDGIDMVMISYGYKF
jgi:lipid A 3-O-deacylase